MDTAPIIGISRHRLGSDGRGIRTLVAFHGCPLSCLYCLNPSCLSPISDSQLMSVDDIVKILHKDALYFLATQGGVTFGGGEPLLRYDFIRKVIEKNAEKLDVTLETSLNVPRKNIEAVLPYIREFIVDIKDMDDTIYHSYTCRHNDQVKENLRWMIEQGYADRIMCRVPLIPDFNDENAQERSIAELKEMGITRFNRFTYRTNTKGQTNV